MTSAFANLAPTTTRGGAISLIAAINPNPQPPDCGVPLR
jgi:hypothetical protein